MVMMQENTKLTDLALTMNHVILFCYVLSP